MPPARLRALHPGGAAAHLVLFVLALVLAVLRPDVAPAQLVPDIAAGPDAPGAAPEEPSVAEALRLLAIVLDDPEARAALVEQLRAVEPADPADPAAPPPEPPAEPTVPEILAEQTLGALQQLGDEVVALLRGLVDIREIVERARTFDFAAVDDVLLAVLLTIVITLAANWSLRRASRSLMRRLEAGAAGVTLGVLLIWKLAAAAVEAAVVLAAWSVGLAVTVAAFYGDVATAQGLFLHAFLVTELVKVGIRVLFRPRHGQLRLLIRDDGIARHWNFWLARIAGVLGYGLLFLVPLTEPYTSDAFTDWLELLVVVISLVMAIVLVLRNRSRTRDAVADRSAALPPGVLASSLALLARIWHLIALGYLLALFVVWRAHPGEAEQYMVRATLLSALAIVAGALIIAVLSRRIADGIVLSERVRERLPLLEARLNGLMPGVLKVARVLVVVLVVATILTVWGIFDVPAWAGSPTGRAVLGSLVWVVAILLVAGVAWVLVSSWIEYRLNPDVGTLPTPRERTLLALFSNAFVIALVMMTLMLVLNELGLNIAPLLAGAGVVGLAIGFGAQKLVQDIINGAFIQFENTMNEGDVVTAAGITGVVEKLTIRSVSLRDLQGHYHMIPFSGVDTVTNFMKGFSFHVAEIGVAYREDIAEVKDAMQEAFDLLMETEHRAHILPPLEMQGITEFAESAVMVRARIKTLPGQQWAIGRAYNEVLKQVFDARDIEIPFPHRTIYLGVDKDGSAPPLNLRTLDNGRDRPDDRAAPSGGAPAAPVVDPVPPDPELTPPASDED